MQSPQLQPPEDRPPVSKRPSKQPAFIGVLAGFLTSHPPPPHTDCPPPTVPSKLRYDVYGTLLLLPPTSPLVTDPWNSYISSLEPETRKHFYKDLASAFNVTHIAVNSPIPTRETADGNVIRAPQITPLHGEFGDIASDDFEAVFWAYTSQHGIYQTWAPLHTMFSRGNITEKERIYNLVSAQLVPLSSRERSAGRRKIAAVDLFVGIGYFAFSYLKAGVDVVYGWDINRWSIEGCRRGAEGNKWSVEVPTKGQIEGNRANDVRLVIHEESNEGAPERLRRMKSRIIEAGDEWHSVKHVNLGLLPTSEGAYKTAVEVIGLNDTKDTSWVHVHENVAKDDAEEMKSSIIEKFKVLAVDANIPGDVSCDHIEFVKSWAPGVWHCVFDIRITPISRIIKTL
ncbi:hypothetical protein H072_6147 [Dactylellina haptotyla CBS 200.50]|uniref:tRNA wybutosine-synthesizing protein 2 n=1 Tax=Dactylellina haptotyla (strain CBS 200.50) TaxID=1284197 RepID=S8AAS2_DACHA|nr:hypothetical protein H072_6147 [Dactylellina haptotyla CBS 200.50]